jgi:endonuclease-3 related protein
MSFFRRIFETLREYYETKPPHPWWPEEPLEVIIGAVLVQGTTWKSVNRVLEEFRLRNLLDFQRIFELDDEELVNLIRPVGFHTKKTKRLKEITRLFLERSHGRTEHFFARDIDLIRSELLSISGIGPGTADNILLYAGKIPIYMVDPFTTRILIRHGVVSSHAKNSEIQHLIHQELTPDEEPYGAKLFRDFQSLLVRLGRDFCDKSTPDCQMCPLNAFLPEEGPIGLEKQTRAASKVKRQSVPKTEPAALSQPKPVEELVLDETERKIVEQFGEEPILIDSIIHTTGLSVPVVRATIAILEMKKILRQVEGNQVRRIR